MNRFTLALLLSLSACGDWEDDHRDGALESEGTFSTQLSEEVSVSGQRCEGGERPGVPGEVRSCERNQWIITVQQTGTCLGPNCNPSFQQPFIAELRSANLDDTDFNFYEIVPVTAVRLDVLEVINNVWVRTAPDGATEALIRNRAPTTTTGLPTGTLPGSTI